MCFSLCSGVEASVELFILCLFTPWVHTLLHFINISPPSGVKVVDGIEVSDAGRSLNELK